MMQRLLSGSSDQVYLARSVLDAAGIPCEVRNDAVSQAMVGVPFETELWVAEPDYSAARELLSSHKDLSKT